MMHWHPEKSTRARCRSICALAAKFAMAGMPFPCLRSTRRRYSTTTRKLIASNRELVMNVMQGFVETIHLFKTRPEIVVPLLQRYLEIENRKAAGTVCISRTGISTSSAAIISRNAVVARLSCEEIPGRAVSLKESDIADSSFIDELERSGFIDRLYAEIP